jgi:hypothetical protein
MQIKLFPYDLSVESFDTVPIFVTSGTEADFVAASGTLTLEGGPTCKPIECPTENTQRLR